MKVVREARRFSAKEKAYEKAVRSSITINLLKQKEKQLFPPVPDLTKISRFYKTAEVIKHPDAAVGANENRASSIDLKNLSHLVGNETFWAILFDGKHVIRTMYKDKLLIPTKSLAD